MFLAWLVHMQSVSHNDGRSPASPDILYILNAEKDVELEVRASWQPNSTSL